MKKLLQVFAAFICLSGIAPAANAIGISIEVGDRPYYSHGPHYWVGGTRYCWVPGHWRWRYHHKYWVHGHYRPC